MNRNMKDGKKTERLVRLIQETLKEIPETNIYSNFKIKNISGRKREIDVLIDSSINSMNIKIAIECKDYKRPVSVEKIEAFNSKCMRIEGISKKVFVSTSGYQADAVEAAKDFNIDLYRIDDISPEKITSWFPIMQLKQNIKIKLPLKIHLFGEKDDINKLPQKDELIVYSPDEKDPINIVGFVWNNFVKQKQHEIWNYLILNTLKRTETEKVNQHISLPFIMHLKGVYTLATDRNKFSIKKIEGELEVWFEEQPANITESKAYLNKSGTSQANTLSIDLGKNETTDIIFSKQNKISMFHTDSHGNVNQLKTLATYNLKTDKLEILDRKNEG